MHHDFISVPLKNCLPPESTNLSLKYNPPARNSTELSDWVSVVDTDTPSIPTSLSDNSITTVLEKFAENQASDQNSPRAIAKQLFDKINFSSEVSFRFCAHLLLI